MKEVILIIKLFQRNKNTQSLNEFLNIKNIKENYLYTLDEQVISFIKVNPMNIELLSDKELEAKMDSSSIEFSNEQYPYKIIVVPRAVDISDYIREQEELRNKLDIAFKKNIYNKIDKTENKNDNIENQKTINENIIKLYKEGFSKEEISKKLNCAITEIDIVIDMENIKK